MNKNLSLVIQKSGSHRYAFIRRSVSRSKEHPKGTSVNVMRFGDVDEIDFAGRGFSSAEEYMASVLADFQAKEDSGSLYTIDPSEERAAGEEQACNYGSLAVARAFWEMGLPKTLSSIRESKDLRFEYSLGAITLSLVNSMVMGGASKLAAFSGFGRYALKCGDRLHDVYRSLEVLADAKDEINARTYKKLQSYLGKSSKVFFYDVTDRAVSAEGDTAFESYGCPLRTSKRGKSGAYTALVQLGILIDEWGLVVGMIVFPGKCNEQPSLRRIQEAIGKEMPLDNVVVCTGAGLAGGQNRVMNSSNGRSFICTHSLARSKGYVREWALKQDGFVDADGVATTPESLIEEWAGADADRRKELYGVVLSKSRSINDPIEGFDDDGNALSYPIEQTLVVTFSLKYWLQQRRSFEEDLEMARKVVSGERGCDGAKKETGFRRLLTETAVTKDGEVAEKTYSIDEGRAADETALFGYYCQATNMDEKASYILSVVKMRWQVEYDFRTMKSDLSGPIFHWNDKRIVGHFELMCLALNALKAIQYKMYEAAGFQAFAIGKIPKKTKRRMADPSKLGAWDVTSHSIQEAIASMEGTKIKAKVAGTEIPVELVASSAKRTTITDAISDYIGISPARKYYEAKEFERIAKCDKL